MSGTEATTPLITLPAAFEGLLGTLALLTAAEVPTLAVIGGMAVNIRVSTADDAHRVTQDIDVVAGDDTPTALDTAGPVRITTVGDGSTVEVAVATPAGLIAAKSHAAGYPRPARRATKHGGDIFDMFRLIEVFDTRGELRAELADAPFELGRLIAQVVRAEILANPPQAMRQMSPAGSTALDIDRIIDVMEPFAAALG